MLRVFELDVGCSADGGDLVLLELFEVLSEVLSTDPYLPQFALPVNDLLAVILVDA